VAGCVALTAAPWRRTHDLAQLHGRWAIWSVPTQSYHPAPNRLPGPRRLRRDNRGCASSYARLLHAHTARAGLWPYSYDSCDLGTFPDQVDQSGNPAVVKSSGLSSMPGQRLSACTCPDSDHPGPSYSVGRSSPEIDVFETQSERRCALRVSQADPRRQSTSGASRAKPRRARSSRRLTRATSSPRTRRPQ
jgi:hypothetical protein